MSLLLTGLLEKIDSLQSIIAFGDGIEIMGPYVSSVEKLYDTKEAQVLEIKNAIEALDSMTTVQIPENYQLIATMLRLWVSSRDV